MKTLKRRILNLTLAGTLSAPSLPVLAATVMPDFRQVDGNGDGVVSLQEFEARGGFEQAFFEGDANHDKRLNSSEYVKAVANHDRIQAGKYVDDAWITAKVKALLLKDERVKGLDVNVETHQGTVQLSGWVSSSAQITHSEQLARSIEGVRGVRNDLQLKR